MSTLTSIPTHNTVQFVFDNIDVREGTLKLTFFWNIPVVSADISGIPKEFIPEPFEPRIIRYINTPNFIYQCRSRIIVKYPVWEREIERLFTEITFHDFECTMYDTASTADVLSSSQTPATGHEANGLQLINVAAMPTPQLTIGPGVKERLFTKYINITDFVDVYCQMEFKELGQSQYRPLVLGKMQQSIQGHDLRWYTESGGANPYLNQISNKATDAERTWDLKFVHIAMAGLGNTPVVPQVLDPSNSNGNATYYMPFWNSDSTVPNRALPYDTSEGVPIEQFCAEGTYTANISPGDNILRPLLWRRHINAKLFIHTVLDYQFGVGNWTFECDDSPFTFYYGAIEPGGAAGQIQIDSTYKVVVNLASEDTRKWLLIPQCIFGLYKSLNVKDDNHPIPYIVSGYSDRFKTVFEALMDICIFCGYRMKVNLDTSGPITKAHIKFKDRTKSEESRFDTIVPTSAEPVAAPESESGISASRLTSFRNARTDDGWFDDWFAAKLLNLSGTPPAWNQTCDKSNDNVTIRMANPYVVPQNAPSAVNIESTLCFGGDQNWGESGGSGVGFYSTGSPNNAAFISNPSYPEGDIFTEAWPMLTPLVGTGHTYLDQLSVPGHVGFKFAPIMRASFNYTDSNGTTQLVVCDAARQLHARFYALHFVKAETKYVEKFATITQFTDSTPGSPTLGQRSSSFVDVLNQHTIFDDLYYVKRVSVDFNEVTTDIESMQSTLINRIFESNGGMDWHDDTQQSGHLTGTPPDTGGGPGVSGGGGITGP